MARLHSGYGQRPIPTDGADFAGDGMQRAGTRIAKRVDALGVKVLSQHVAARLPDLLEGEALLPADHPVSTPLLLGGRLAPSKQVGNHLGKFERIAFANLFGGAVGPDRHPIEL